MSDLAATNCQTSCDRDCGCGWNMGNNCSWIWILILLFFCNNNGSTWGRSDGCGSCNSCDSIIWIIILLFFFNNGGSSCMNCGC